MAAPLKDSLDAAVVGRIGDDLAAVAPRFRRSAFVADATARFADLELTARVAAVAQAMRAHLPADPAAAIAVIRRALPAPAEAAQWQATESFAMWPYTRYVSDHGLACFEEAMAAQYELTQLFTAEFSIRTFLEHRYEPTMARLGEWTADPSEHVRRLVSEGSRPRLPWAPRLRRFVADPGPVLELLEPLRDDPSAYVRRSVANNLNDIAKDHPDVTLAVCRRWLGEEPDRRPLVRHALRTLVKAGDSQALAVLGFPADSPLRIAGCRVAPGRVPIGGSITVEVDVVNPGPRSAAGVVDLRVSFARPRGATTRVFRGAEFELAPGAGRVVRKRVSLRQMSTRAVYPGRHGVTPVLNGEPGLPAAFRVLAAG